MNGKKRKKKLLIALVVILLLIAAVPAIVMYVAKSFTAQETVVRTDWTTDVGEVFEQNQELQIQYAEAELGDGIRVLQLVPMDIETDGFTYYDTAVQERLDSALEDLKADGMDWSADAPLAVLNPYGTGSNGLYLYFRTDLETQVSYTIHVEDESIPDFTAAAAEADGKTYTRTHEFQIIGLVPGMTNEVTLTLTGSWGNVRQIVHFQVDMPETQSGYPTRLDYTDGTSEAEQAEGMYAMMRVNGYLGYGFFLTMTAYSVMKWCWRVTALTESCLMTETLSPAYQMESLPASMAWDRRSRSMTWEITPSIMISASDRTERFWPLLSWRVRKMWKTSSFPSMWKAEK